jgi:sulfatase modifying factor 1
MVCGKKGCVLTFVGSRGIGQVAAFAIVAMGCYTQIPTVSPDANLGGNGGGGADATGGSGGGRDAATNPGNDAAATTCTTGSKVCDGRCIPSAACCGPCSCDGLAPTCGPNRNEDCCTSLLITGGTFNRDNDPTYPATVGDFHLDRFEVTVGRFNRFVAAGQGLQSTAPQVGSGKNDLDTKDPGWDAAWNTQLATTVQAFATNVQCINATFISGDDVLPMNCITWYEAYAFCIWDGGRLPTEAEWTYAAAGGGLSDGQRVYPWSVPPSSTSTGSTYAVTYTSAPAHVGSCSPKGDGKWEHADLTGNVGEWVADYAAPYPLPCYNCANRVAAERRVARGGDWTLPVLANDSSRAQLLPDWREGVYGVRCARR